MGCLVSWGPLEERSWWRSWGCIGLSTAPCWAGSSPLLLTGDEASAAEIQCVWGMGLCHRHGIECRRILSLADRFCTSWMRRSVRFPPYVPWMHAVVRHVPPGNCREWWSRLWCVVPHPGRGWCHPWLYRRCPGLTGHRNSVFYISFYHVCHSMLSGDDFPRIASVGGKLPSCPGWRILWSLPAWPWCLRQ